MHATGSEDSTPCRTHIFLSLVVSGTRTPEHFKSRMYAWLKFAQVTLHLWCLEWFAPLRIQNTSSFVMYHPNLGLAPESFTSFFCASSKPPQTTCSTKPERTSLTEIRCHLSATSLERQSGFLANHITLTGYSSSQKISKIQKCLHPHTFLMTQIRNIWQKWHSGSTVFLFTSQMIEIAKYACELWTVHPQLQHVQNCTQHNHISSCEHAWLKSCKAQGLHIIFVSFKYLSSSCHVSPALVCFLSYLSADFTDAHNTSGSRWTFGTLWTITLPRSPTEWRFHADSHSCRWGAQNHRDHCHRRRSDQSWRPRTQKNWARQKPWNRSVSSPWKICEKFSYWRKRGI